MSSGAGVRVSFIVFAYNQESLVREAVAGAFAQTYQPLEIILSDDASPDGTFRIMEEMAAAYDGPHKVVLNRNPQNLGITAHVDRATEISTGELLLQNSGDDVSVPDRTEKMVAAWLASGRRSKAIHTARYRLDYDGINHGVIDDERVIAHMTPLEMIRDHGTLVGASLAWTRDLHEIFGPMAPAAILDDFPIVFRAALLGEVDYLPEPLLYYRQGGVTTRPIGDFGHHYLQGFRIRNLRWHRSFWLSHLQDMEVVEPPDVEQCRALCRQKIAEADFVIGLAEAPLWKRLCMLPRNVLRSLSSGRPHYTTETLKYLLAPVYARWRTFRGHRLRRVQG
jgi:glycosyltransferase involved in cell wall biosynthesis